MRKQYNYKRIVLLLLNTLIYVMIGYAQSELKFKKIDQIQGLSSGKTHSIIKGKNGFIWIGTENGLNRYDGKQLKIYNKQNSSLSSNNVTDLLLDKSGRLWIATTNGGLNRYSQNNDDFLVFKNNPDDFNSLPSNQINTLFEDSNGNLWLGSENGLSLFNESTETFSNYNQSSVKSHPISHNMVMSIYEDFRGDLWIGTFGGGLNKFSITSKKFEQIHAKESHFIDFIRVLTPLNKFTLLIGTNGGGLIKMNLKTLSFEKYFEKKMHVEHEPPIIRCIHKDRKGDIWIGTDGNGIFKVKDPNNDKPKVFNFLNNPQYNESLSSNAIYDIFEDNEFNIWIGTAWNGLNILEAKSNYDLIFSDIKGINPAPVLSIYKNDKNLYMGLDGKGLTIYNPKTNAIQYLNSKLNTSIGGDYIQSIVQGKNENLWLGTFTNGLINFNPKTGSYIQYKHNPKNSSTIRFNEVRSMVEDSSKLWIGSWGGGLSCLNIISKKFSCFSTNTSDSISTGNDNILSIVKDGNKLWLATFGGGLNQYDIRSRKFIRYQYDENNANTISSNLVLSILLDSKRNLWVGTSEGGINLFNIKTKLFNRFDKHKDLRYQTITAILEDNTGNIWFSTKQSIFKYDYNLDKFTRYPKLANEYHINSSFKDANGYLHFGTTNGIIRFHPSKVDHQGVQPKVKITSFKLFNKEIQIGKDEILKKNIVFEDEIVLKHNLNVITFEFAALQFPSSSNCEYSIQMENFDQNWRQIGKDRTITYTNLSPGNYKFKVKSREWGDEWGEKFTSLNIVILKPFWLEWWAFIFYGFLIILIFYVFQKYIVAWEKMKTKLRLEKMTHEKDNELHQIKQKFFTNISHEIRTPVTLILSSLKYLKKNDEMDSCKVLNPMKTVQRNSSHLLKLIDEMLDFRKLNHEDIQLKFVKYNWVEFCRDIFESFSDLANQKNISYTFESSDRIMDLWFDKSQMKKVVYNLLSNAFKFTAMRGGIHFSISQTENIVCIQIKDSGCGIGKKQILHIFNRFYQINTSGNKDSRGFGLGLSISKKIMNLHHGKIKVTSEKGHGSVFSLKLKKGKNHFKNYLQLENKFKVEDLNDPIENNTLDSGIKLELAPDRNSNKQTLLLVEDNKDIRSYISSFLKNEFEIIQASNGREGIQKAMQKMPDLIICDIMMPIMDGLSLTKSLKSNIKTSHIPIVLLTAKASADNQMEGYDMGADAYITKPFHESLLKCQIKNILKNRQLLHEIFWSNELIPISKLKLNASNQEFIQKLINLIETNLNSESLNADFISQELGMSHSVIYKKIKVLTGMSFLGFIRDFKLKTAKKLLKEQNFSVLDASYHVGYSDRKYFSKLFKQRFGKCPSEYLDNN